MDSDLLRTKILASKKYGVLEPAFVDSVIRELSNRYKSKELEAKVKAKLHQVWGAYFNGVPKYSKLPTQFQFQSEALGREMAIKNLLKIHSSTKERVDSYKIFWEWLFSNSKPRRIVDLGSGFNPISLLDSSYQIDSYTAVDIDREMIDFLNRVMAGASFKFTALVDTVSWEKSWNCDLTIALKFLPVIEQQSEGGSVKLLKNICSPFCLISFPTKSLGGKSKGMESSYFERLTQLIHLHGLEDRYGDPISRLEIENELFLLYSVKS